MDQTLKSIGLRSGRGLNSLLHNRQKLSLHQAWVLLEIWKEYSPVGRWNLHFWSALLYHARKGPKFHRYAHLCWLWNPAAQKSKESSKFLTLQNHDWCWLLVNMFSGKSFECRSALWCFIDWTFPLQWIFFLLIKQFHPSACQISANSKEDQFSQLSFVVKGQ